MKEYRDIAQGSDEWFRLRRGIPTASQIHRIVTPKTLKLSDQRGRYLCEKLAERILGQSEEGLETDFMTRGSQQERSAVSWFELVTGLQTRASGFCVTDDGSSGCSVDRFILGESGEPVGVLEVKTPGAAKHLMAVLEYDAAEHRIQCQHALMVTGLAYGFRLSYHDDLPKSLVQFHRDEEAITAIREALARFSEELDEAERRVRVEMGISDAA